jgi:hypothetical protein
MGELVSVIIPTTDKEFSMAERCVQSVKDSTYKNIEIIVINEGKERAEQRNIGIEKSNGSFVIYLDSDQFVSPYLIEECVKLMNCGYGSLYIPEIIITPGIFAYIRNWERSFYNSTPIDCIRVFRRIGCPRFDVSLRGPEDADFDRRVKGIKTITKTPLYHYDNIGMLDYFRKKNYYASSMKKFAGMYPSDLVLNWKWRCFRVFFERNGWKRVLKRPDLMFLVWIIVFIRGLIYLRKRY